MALAWVVAAARTRRSASSSGSRRCGRASTGSPWPTTGPRGPSVARPPPCCRSTRSPTSRSGRLVVAGRHGRPLARGGRAVDGPRRAGRPAGRWRGGGAGRGRDRCSAAGYRVVVARQSDPDDAGAGVIELIPPGAAMPPGPRTRANRPCSTRPEDRVTPTSCRARACSRHPSGSTSAPSRRSRPRGSSRRPPSRRSALAASPPAWSDCSARSSSASTDPGSCDGCRPERDRATDRAGTPTRRLPHRRPARACGRPSNSPRASGPPVATRRVTAVAEAAPDPVERLLGLIREELSPRSAAPDRDRTGSLVADRGDRPGGGRGAAGRQGRVGRLQPAVHRRAALGGRLLRPHRDPLHRPRPARRDARPRLPRQLSQPGTRPTTSSRATICCDAARSTPTFGNHRRCGPPARAARLDRRAGAGPATRPRPPWRRPRRAREGPTWARSAELWMPCRRSTRSGTSAASSRSCSRSSGPPCSASRCSASRPYRQRRAIHPVPGRRSERTDLIRHKLDRSPLLRAAIEDDAGTSSSGTICGPSSPRSARLRRSRAAHRSRPGRGTRRRADAALRRLRPRARYLAADLPDRPVSAQYDEASA